MFKKKKTEAPKTVEVGERVEYKPTPQFLLETDEFKFYKLGMEYKVFKKYTNSIGVISWIDDSFLDYTGPYNTLKDEDSKLWAVLKELETRCKCCK